MQELDCDEQNCVEAFAAMIERGFLKQDELMAPFLEKESMPAPLPRAKRRAQHGEDAVSKRVNKRELDAHFQQYLDEKIVFIV